MLNNNKSIKAPSRATPYWLGAAAVALLAGNLIFTNLEPENSIKFKDHVQWRTFEEGKQEAIKRSMPIFEVVTGDVDGAQYKSLQRYYFADPTLAATINKDYIPVRTESQSSYNRWEPQLQISCNKEKKKSDFVTVRIIPLEFQNRSCDDYRLPHFYTGTNFKQAMLNFLSENKNFHYNNYSYSGNTLASHNWSKLSEVEAKAKKEDKKVLYFFYRQFDDSCLNMMRYPFDDFNQKKLIQKNFASAIVLERSSPTAKNPQFVTDLVNKFDVLSYPTLVSLDPKTGKFNKLGGTYNRNEIDDFIKKEISH